MDDTGTTSLEQIRAFLANGDGVRFTGQKRGEVYGWVERTLVQHEYGTLRRPERGLVRQYVARMTGLSRAQVARLISDYLRTGKVTATQYQRARFASRYTATDIGLLAYVDKAHGNLSGPATKRILQREYEEYGQSVYQNIAGISVAQLYRLRGSASYRQRNQTYQPTKPTVVPIGERRKPQPGGRPGHLRVDTVHQGDQDGVKGVYHINAVDEVTQWAVVAAVPQISETWLIPLLEGLLEQFPFVIRGFHSDNGSEFINYTVAKLLNKLKVAQTKSRAGHSNDNGLVEAKNGAIVRKHLGYSHISAPHAEAVNQFQRDYLNPYVNFHRPCAVATVVTAANGKRCRVYRRWETPFELLKQIPDAAQYLRPGQSMQHLEEYARRQSDTEAALDLQNAKRKLFARVQRRRA
jgi:transposase InsO family protein